jgi:hypothetical protein
MHPLIRISFTLILLCFTASDIIAGNRSFMPVQPAYFHISQIEKVDSFLSVSLPIIPANTTDLSDGKETSVSMGRICSCQILNLESSNYDHRNMVLLAEKSNDGSSTAYSIAKNRIQKEKKHLKQMFYEKVKVVAEWQAAGSCRSLFFRLQTADSHLQLYEILNADQ